MIPFQKGSPYLADINQLIGLATQMGLVFGHFDKAVSNATKCGTWQDIQASHQDYNRRDGLSLKLSNMYGILALLSVGWTGALIILILEVCFLRKEEEKVKYPADKTAWQGPSPENY